MPHAPAPQLEISRILMQERRKHRCLHQSADSRISVKRTMALRVTAEPLAIRRIAVPGLTQQGDHSNEGNGDGIGHRFRARNGDLRVFLRAPNGVFSTFDTPQLGSFPGAAAINSSGAVAGNVQNSVCTDVSCTTTLLSFLRAANGTVKQVNDPQAVQGTGVLGVNPAGEMFGIYSDANGIQHGFVTKH